MCACQWVPVRCASPAHTAADKLRAWREVRGRVWSSGQEEGNPQVMWVDVAEQCTQAKPHGLSHSTSSYIPRGRIYIW